MIFIASVSVECYISAILANKKVKKVEANKNGNKNNNNNNNIPLVVRWMIDLSVCYHTVCAYDDDSGVDTTGYGVNAHTNANTNGNTNTTNTLDTPVCMGVEVEVGVEMNPMSPKQQYQSECQSEYQSDGSNTNNTNTTNNNSNYPTNTTTTTTTTTTTAINSDTHMGQYGNLEHRYTWLRGSRALDRISRVVLPIGYCIAIGVLFMKR